MVLNHSVQSNSFGSDIKGIIDIRKRFPYNPLIGYININFLKEKVILLTELLLNVPIDTLSLKKSWRYDGEGDTTLFCFRDFHLF